MAQAIVRGNPITLDGFYIDGSGDPSDPPDPRVSIVDASGVTVVNLDTPTNVALGHFQYVYDVSGQAMLGAWAARWYGTVDGQPLTDEDGFTVVSASQTLPSGSGEGTTCTPWATVDDAGDELQAYDIDPDEVDEAFQIASDVLYQLTGRVYPGVCDDFIRPQAQWRSIEGTPKWWPSTGSGSPWGWCSCHRPRDSSCARMPEIRLPGHPVVADSIVVKIDGVVFEDWRLDDHRFLLRTDGIGWPCCQDLRAEDTEDNTFSIAYSYGRSPDVGGKNAAVQLGTWIFADAHPESAGRCSPPKRATRVTRAGTTVDLKDLSSIMENGLTGIASVDLWVASKLLGRKRRPSAVLVPGHHRSARRTNR